MKYPKVAKRPRVCIRVPFFPFPFLPESQPPIPSPNPLLAAQKIVPKQRNQKKKSKYIEQIHRFHVAKNSNPIQYYPVESLPINAHFPISMQNSTSLAMFSLKMMQYPNQKECECHAMLCNMQLFCVVRNGEEGMYDE